MTKASNYFYLTLTELDSRDGYTVADVHKCFAESLCSVRQVVSPPEFTMERCACIGLTETTMCATLFLKYERFRYSLLRYSDPHITDSYQLIR